MNRLWIICAMLSVSTAACPSSKSSRQDHAVLKPDQRLAPKKVAAPDAGTPTSKPTRKQIIIGEGGTLPKERILEVIHANRPKIRACYDAVSSSRSGRRDRVLARWVIGPDGAVTEANIESSTLSSTRLVTCITQVIRTWKFQKPLGGGIVEVRYPFVFKASTP